MKCKILLLRSESEEKNQTGGTKLTEQDSSKSGGVDGKVLVGGGTGFIRIFCHAIWRAQKLHQRHPVTPAEIRKFYLNIF